MSSPTYYNTAHLYERLSGRESKVYEYLERVVQAEFRLDTSIDDRLQEACSQNHNLIPATMKDCIAQTFSLAGCENLRTLLRSVKRVATCSAIYKETLSEEHVRLIAALTIEQDRGSSLQGREFYRHAYQNALIGGMRLQDKTDHSDERRFLSKYYPEARGYVFSDAIYTFVVDGVFDSEQAMREIHEAKRRLADPHSLFIQSLDRDRIYYMSDSEARGWALEAKNFLHTGTSTQAKTALRLINIAEFLAWSMGECLDPELVSLVEHRLESAASAGDECFVDVYLTQESLPETQRLARTFRTQVAAASVAHRCELVLSAVLSKDVHALSESLRNISSEQTRAVVNSLFDYKNGCPTLRELHNVRSTHRAFYFRALKRIADVIQQIGAPIDVEQFRSYCLVRLLFEQMDQRDIFQMRRVFSD